MQVVLVMDNPNSLGDVLNSQSFSIGSLRSDAPTVVHRSIGILAYVCSQRHLGTCIDGSLLTLTLTWIQTEATETRLQVKTKLQHFDATNPFLVN